MRVSFRGELFLAVYGVTLLTSLLFSCAGPRYLKTEEATPDEIKGTYDLILYGHRYSDDFKNVAFLIKEGGKYVFELYAPAFYYTVKKGLTAKKALEEADKWVRFHYAYLGSRLSKILDFDGTLIGYELRPLYSGLDFGFQDVIEVHYVIKGDKVIASVGLKPEIGETPIEPLILRPRVK